jgi:nitronate monooxygenase
VRLDGNTARGWTVPHAPNLKLCALTVLRTKACDLLRCQYPVVLAGMGGVARSELVTAVTEAGGFGFLGMVRESPSLIRQEVEAIRRLTSKPFGVNLIPAATDRELLERQLCMCIELAVPVVALFWDLVPSVVERLRDAGILVVCQVGSAKEGHSAQRAGAQILIAQGVEAGGHVRGTTSLKLLLPEVIASSDVPVLAAGGMVDGGDLVDALSSGAAGVVIGTAFLASPESFAHEYHTNNGSLMLSPKTRFSQTSFISIGPSAHLFASCRTVLLVAREVIRSARAVSLVKRKDARSTSSAPTLHYAQ